MPKVGMEPVRRRQVINATLERIAGNGFEGLTLDTIAKTAGISKGVIAYYFSNKEELIAQSFEAFLDHYGRIVEVALEGASSALEMLDQMVDLVIFPPASTDCFDSDFDFFIQLSKERYFGLLIRYYARIINSDRLRKSYQQFYDQYLAGLIQIIEFGITRKEFFVKNARSSAYHLLAQLDGIILYQALGFQPFDESAVISSCKQCIRLLLKEESE